MDTNTNQLTITRILMGVGVMFIVIALGVFITKNWNYLPDLIKNSMLLIVSVGFFTASRAFRVKKDLNTVASIFYYLASLFIGAFLVISMGGIHAHQMETNALLLIIANVTVIALITARVFFLRQVSDLVSLVITMQPLSLFIGVYFNSRTCLIILSSFIFLAVSILYLKLKSYDRFNLAVDVIIWVQFGIQYILALVSMSLMGQTREDDFAGLFAGLALLVGITFSYIYTENGSQKTGLRYAQTFSIGLAVISLVVFIIDFIDFVHVSNSIVEIECVEVIVYLFLLIALLLLDRVEALVLAISIAAIMNFMQVTLDDYLYIPMITAVCFGLMIVMQVFVKGKGIDACLQLEGNTKYSTNFAIKDFIQYTVIIGITGVVLLISNIFDDADLYRGYIGFFAVLILSFANFIASINLLIHNHTAKRVIATINLFNYVCGLAEIEFFNDSYLINGEDVYFNCEIFSTILLLATLMLGIIWKGANTKTIRNFQFVLVAMVFFGDLSYNLSNGDIFTLLYIGIAAAVTMIIGGAKSSRRYVILSALTLVSLVLYETKDFWLSISWWIYLFVVGLALVVYAAKREWNRA
ncbi:MAG: DUF2157 domain-containing protein [Lachnospiraceae bacterium]|nr:DUF2157 domain-containing protein [Lachnospiraceae bacterium]